MKAKNITIIILVVLGMFIFGVIFHSYMVYKANVGEKKINKNLYDIMKEQSLGSTKINGLPDTPGFYSQKQKEGVYLFDETENDPYPVYFYRGTRELKNNLLFGKFCWKIVRTTETGGIRVIYNGTAVKDKCIDRDRAFIFIGKSQFNLSFKGKTQVGYMYGDEDNPYQNINDSEIKKYIDNWYIKELKNKKNESKLDKKSIYCGDRNEKGNIRSKTLYAGFDRFKKEEPTLKCPLNDSYSVKGGNKALKYPIALLSADEIMLVGRYKDNNDNNYLSSYYTYYLLSPLDFTRYSSYYNNEIDVKLFTVGRNGDRYNTPATEIFVRPAITIKNSVLVRYGVGSEEDPFVI